MTRGGQMASALALALALGGASRAHAGNGSAAQRTPFDRGRIGLNGRAP